MSAANDRAGAAAPRLPPIIKRTLPPSHPQPQCKVLCLLWNTCSWRPHQISHPLPTQPLPSVHLATGFPAPIMPPTEHPRPRAPLTDTPPPRPLAQHPSSSPHLEDFRRDMLVPVFRRSTYAAEMRKQASTSTQAKVVFVDEGNHCRSILAEAIFRTLLSRSPIADQIAVESASLGPCYGETYDDAVVTIAKVLFLFVVVFLLSFPSK